MRTAKETKTGHRQTGTASVRKQRFAMPSREFFLMENKAIFGDGSFPDTCSPTWEGPQVAVGRAWGVWSGSPNSVAMNPGSAGGAAGWPGPRPGPLCGNHSLGSSRGRRGPGAGVESSGVNRKKERATYDRRLGEAGAKGRKAGGRGWKCFPRLTRTQLPRLFIRIPWVRARACGRARTRRGSRAEVSPSNTGQQPRRRD